MQIVYIHGLNSDANAIKGQELANFCAKYFPEIKVVVPDLNVPPNEVVQLLTQIIHEDPNTGIVGSSLGGFFATLMSNQIGCKAVLLNPSTNPAKSLHRFFPTNFDELSDDSVIYTTTGGWEIRKQDIFWLANHRPTFAKYPENILVILKQGDALLDYRQAVEYYSQPQVDKNGQCHLIIEPDGDHRMSDFAEKLPQVIQFLFAKPLITCTTSVL